MRGSLLFGLAAGALLLPAVSFAETPADPGKASRGALVTDLLAGEDAEALDLAVFNPFNLIAIPHALRTLTQFAGRLIRTSTDTGRVIILDSRLLTRRYGKRIIDALPPFRRRASMPPRPPFTSKQQECRYERNYRQRSHPVRWHVEPDG